MKTKQLRGLILQQLKTVCTCPVYYGRAPEEARNFVVFSCEEMQNSDGRFQWETEVNVVGYGFDSGAVEDLTDQIQKLLNGSIHFPDGIAVYIYADSRRNVAEEDRLVIRRRLTFTTYLYEME